MFLVLFWGLAFVAIKQALVHMSWITLTFLRFALADVLFFGYLTPTLPGEGRPALSHPPCVRRFHRLSPLPEPRRIRCVRHRGDGRPHHCLDARLHRGARRLPPSGTPPAIPGSGNRPRVRGTRGN